MADHPTWPAYGWAIAYRHNQDLKGNNYCHFRIGCIGGMPLIFATRKQARECIRDTLFPCPQKVVKIKISEVGNG